VEAGSVVEGLETYMMDDRMVWVGLGSTFRTMNVCMCIMKSMGKRQRRLLGKLRTCTITTEDLYNYNWCDVRTELAEL
jgi:hypothetical protein